MVANCGNCESFSFASVRDPDRIKYFCSDEIGDCSFRLPLCFKRSQVSKHLTGCPFHHFKSGQEPPTVTGETAALRTTFMVPNKTIGGTNGSAYTEIWAEGISSDASNLQFQRYVLAGDSTGAAALDADVALFSIEGVTIGSGGTGTHLVRTSTATATHAIRIKINGTYYYLLAVATP